MLTQLEAGDTAPLDKAMPIALGLGALQLVHEVAHYAAAKKNGLSTSVPVAVPSLQLGFFGCVTRLLEFPTSRKALYEFALSGPLLAGTLSFLIYVVGIVLSVGLPVPEIPTIDITSISGAAGAKVDPKALADAAAAASAASAASGVDLMPVIPSALIQSSLLMGTVATALLPALSTSPAVALNPLAVIGFVGTLVNALALLPIGRLDGGRVASAVFGQSQAALVSGVTLLLVGLSTLFGSDDPVLLFFGLFIILFQRPPELPCKDDVTGVPQSYEFAAAVVASVVLLTVLPFPATPVPLDTLPPF